MYVYVCALAIDAGYACRFALFHRDDIVLIATRGGRRPAWIMLLKYKEAISATLAKRERELEAALKVLEFPETIRYTCVYLV